MLVSKSQTRKTAFVHENNIARSDSFPCEPGAPTLSSRPWFFSLLPAADIRRTEVSLNIFQRRLAKLIRYVGRLTPSSKDAAAVARAGRNLLAAAEQGNVDSVQEHIASNADINHAEEGMTALMHAAKHGHLDIIKVLITAGCSINQNGKDGKDALMLAAENGHAQVVDFLIRWGADVTRTESRGLTALTLAAYNGKTGVLQPFIDAGVAIDEPMKNGSTPLMFAAEAGHVEFVNALIDNGAEIDKENTKTKFRALVYAAKQGKIEVVKFLLEKGASVDAKGEEGATPLIEAASQGHIEVVKLLLKNCAAVDARDAQGKTSLWYAAYKGHIEVVELLLEKDATVDVRNARGKTPLWNATNDKHTDLVKLLLEKGASANVEDDQGLTPLMIASFDNDIELVRRLLESDASVNAMDLRGQTPLMKASFNGHVEVVKLLLEKGASVDAKDARGRTALVFAAIYRPYAVLPTLIENYENQYDGLLGVLQHHNKRTKKVIVRAWLHSSKNKLDAVTALACVFASKPRFEVDRKNSAYRALKVLASGGLTLAQEDFERLILTTDMEQSSADYVKQIFADRSNIPSGSRLGNAYWSGNHALVDELIGAPFVTESNPLALKPDTNISALRSRYRTNVNGMYLHTIGRIHDESPRLDWQCDVDPMVHVGWRSKVAATLRSARTEATQASREVKRLLSEPERGFTLVDEVGQPVSARDIRLMDTLFAFELKRNEPLKQLADSPATESMSGTQKEHHEAGKAQAKALLASNKTYKRLKLNMPALAAAKNVEKSVRSGHLSCAEAVVRLDELMSETEKTYFEAPGITSELAYHWFISEVGEVCESLKAMRDKFKRLAPADMI